MLRLAAVLSLVLAPWAAAATHEPAELSPLARQVRKELVTLPWYGIFDHFEFEVNGGKVILSGEVTRPTLKTAAERVVAGLEGVSEVVNRIEVLPVSNHDDRVRLAVFRAVYGNSVLNRYALQRVGAIHIIVKNGNVTLKGVVAQEMEKNVAFIAANSVPGAFSVTNELHVEGRKS
jgi:hyperosmotically inducible protein